MPGTGFNKMQQMNSSLRKLLPHLLAYFIFLAIAFIRFAPVVFEGKQLSQSDNIQALGMQTEARAVHDQTGEWPLWTNATFAGMPAYQIIYPTGSLIKPVFTAILWGNGMAPPHTALLLLMGGMYLLLVVMRVDWRLAIVGALGFGLAANHMALFEAGHSTKLIATAYMGPVLAGIILTYRGKWWLGGGLTALFTGLQIYANHVQITYYFFLTLTVFGVVYLVDALRKKTLNQFLKASAIVVAAVLIGAATNTGRLLTTQEYAAETIRGKSELTQKSKSSGSSAEEGGGLSKDYAFGWSYGVMETWSFLIPNFVGGSSSESFASDPSSKTIQALRQMQSVDEATKLAQQTTHYWGDQPFTGGPVYMGAALLLLFFLGMFFLFRKNKPLFWFSAISVLLSIMLAWGKNFSVLNYLLFDYFPLFNKFRAVTMALGITNFYLVFVGMLGLHHLFSSDTEAGLKKKGVLNAGIFTSGLVVLGLLLSFMLDYQKTGENFPAQVAAAVAEDRAALLRADALRSLLFVALAFGALWFYALGKMKSLVTIIVVGAISVIDIWGIGARFISSDDFIDSTQKRSITAPTAADEQIKSDPDPYYRVADFRRNPFANAITSYHHKSMGGYHAAKLMRYQEMIERYLGDPGTYRNIYGMFNCKYFITQNDQILPNENALGNAWFVREIQTVANGDEEIDALAGLNPATTAVVQKAIADEHLANFQMNFDSNATIKLTHYHPDTMIYNYNASADQLAVFSEVYYPPSKGWSLYIDGTKGADIFKVNFALRAAVLPAGQHEVKMIFEPSTYYNGEMVSLIASIAAILLAAFGIYWFTKNYEFPQADNLPKETAQSPAKKAGRKAGRKK